MSYNESDEIVRCLIEIKQSSKFVLGGQIRTILPLILDDNHFINYIPYDIILEILINSFSDEKLVKRYQEKLAKEFVLPIYRIINLTSNNIHYDSDEFEYFVSEKIQTQIKDNMNKGELWRLFDFPQCPKCDVCSVSRECYYKSWRRINQIIKHKEYKYNHILKLINQFSCDKIK